MFTHVTRQVFIRCRIWRHGLREGISKHKHAVRHFWAILFPAAPVIEVELSNSGLLKVPNKPNKSLVLHHVVLTRSVDTAKRKKKLDQYHASQMLPNLYKWRYTFLMCLVIFSSHFCLFEFSMIFLKILDAILIQCLISYTCIYVTSDRF